MFCGNYSIKEKVNGKDQCYEKSLYATICRNCLKYYGMDLFQSGRNCEGEPYLSKSCNGDCEYNNLNVTCLRKQTNITPLDRSNFYCKSFFNFY